MLAYLQLHAETAAGLKRWLGNESRAETGTRVTVVLKITVIINDMMINDALIGGVETR